MLRPSSFLSWMKGSIDIDEECDNLARRLIDNGHRLSIRARKCHWPNGGRWSIIDHRQQLDRVSIIKPIVYKWSSIGLQIDSLSLSPAHPLSTHCPPTARPLPAHWQLDNRWLMAALAKKNIHDDEANRRGNDDDSHHSGIVMQAMESMAPLLHFPAPLIDWWSQRRQVATSRFAVLTQRSQSPLICSCYTSKLRNYRPPMRNKHQHKRNKNNNNNSNNKNNTQTNKKMKWNQVARYRLLC